LQELSKTADRLSLQRRERLRDVHLLLEPFNHQNGQLGPTDKTARLEVKGRYFAELKEMIEWNLRPEPATVVGVEHS